MDSAAAQHARYRAPALPGALMVDAFQWFAIFGLFVMVLALFNAIDKN